MSVADNASLDLSSGMTLEAWVNPTVDERLAVRHVQGEQGRRAPVVRAVRAGRVGQAGDRARHVEVVHHAAGSQTLAANTWTHIAATYDGATMKVYKNGTLVGSKALTGSLVNTTDPLKFGGNAVWGEWFKGQLDEVRVWKTARTQSQVASDMNTAI